MNTEENIDEKFLRRSNMVELAAEYKCDRRTLLRRLQPILAELGKRPGHYWDRRQMILIRRFLGLPALLFAMFVSASEALARGAAKYSSHNIASMAEDPRMIDDTTLPAVVDPTRGFNPFMVIVIPVLLGLRMSFLLLLLLDPRKRHASYVGLSQDEIKVKDRRRIILIVVQITVASALVVATGYYTALALRR